MDRVTLNQAKKYTDSKVSEMQGSNVTQADLDNMINTILVNGITTEKFENTPANNYEYYRFPASLFASLGNATEVNVKIVMNVRVLNNNITKIGTAFRTGTGSRDSTYKQTKEECTEGSLKNLVYENTVPIQNIKSSGMFVFVMCECVQGSTTEFSMISFDVYVNDIHLNKNDSTELKYDAAGTKTTTVKKMEYNRLIGKKMRIIGDSISSGNRTYATKYWFDKLADDGLEVICDGKSGTGYIKTYTDANVSYQNFYDRIQTYSGSEPDINVIWGGVNDYLSKQTLGTITDTDVTFYGMVDKTINAILTKNPTSSLIVVTPMRNAHTFTHTIELDQYVNAIKEVCSKYGVYCYDAYNDLGLNPALTSHQSYFHDDTHPNDSGHAEKLYPVLRSIISSRM